MAITRVVSPALVAGLAIALAGCVDPAAGDGAEHIITTYFPGDGVVATSYQEADGSVTGRLEDASYEVVATIEWSAASSEWTWARADHAPVVWIHDQLTPTLEGANVADYVLWLRSRNARPGADDSEQGYADKNACIELASAFGQCTTFDSCDAWCAAIP